MSSEKSLIERIIGDHSAELTRKGYTEAELCSFAPPGSFLKQLQEELAVSIIGGITQPRPRQFTLGMKGYTQSDETAIGFQFRYEYRPEQLELRLMAMDANYRGNTRHYPVDSLSRGLPHAADVISQQQNMLSDLSDPVEPAGERLQRQVKAVALWTEQAGILRSRGYSCIAIPRPVTANKPVDPFILRIAEDVRWPDDHALLLTFVARAIQAFENNDQVLFRFLFRGYPDKETIQLRAVHATMDGETHIQFMSGTDGLPYARTVYDKLTRQALLTSARKIMDVPSGDHPGAIRLHRSR